LYDHSIAAAAGFRKVYRYRFEFCGTEYRVFVPHLKCGAPPHFSPLPLRRSSSHSQTLVRPADSPAFPPGFSIAGIVFTEDNLDIMVQPVFHLDMDAFCASVEVPDNPKPAASI